MPGSTRMADSDIDSPIIGLPIRNQNSYVGVQQTFENSNYQLEEL